MEKISEVKCEIFQEIEKKIVIDFFIKTVN